MTALYIGGFSQGKHMLASKLHPDAVIVPKLHERVREMLMNGEDPATLLPDLRGKVIVCDEVGSGVVPLDPAERIWREAVGRLCCTLAAEADLVVRVTAGIPQALKGDLP